VTLVFTLLTIAVLGLVAAVALGWFGAGLDAPTSSLPPVELSEGPIAPADVDRLHFAPALRGYRMDQVDLALDRLAGELARRDTEIARWRALAEDGTHPVDIAPLSFTPPEG
jgi:DivIVA domain-containing protein